MNMLDHAFFRSKDKPPRAPQKIIVKEWYRGYALACELYSMPAARKAVDRVWAERIACAPDAKARAKVLADERRLIEKTRYEARSTRPEKRERKPHA
jgi:hypothetical protein